MAAILKKDYVRNALNLNRDQWKPTFTKFDCFLLILSVGTYVADISTDTIVIVQYFLKQYTVWAVLTLLLVILPSFIVQIFSFRWHILDGNVNTSCWMVHIFHLGIFNRYIKLLKLGLKARKSNALADFQQFYQQQSDICMLRLFESFMESAPQLVLQLHIMLSTEKWNIWTGISAGASLISLSWGISAYSKAMRNFRVDKQRLSVCGMILQIVWRSGTVSSRILSMVLFATVFGPWLILIGVAHWIAMTVWVVFQDTDFCTTWWEERLYNCVVGAIYCFCFFNLKEGRSRCRSTIFYTITFLQNIGFLLSYYLTRNEEIQQDLIAYVVMIAFAVGVFSMLLYYRFLHPSGPIHLCKLESADDDISIKEIKIYTEAENFEQNEMDNSIFTARSPLVELTANSSTPYRHSFFYTDTHKICKWNRSENEKSFVSIYSCQGIDHHSHSQNCSLINVNPNDSISKEDVVMSSFPLKSRLASRHKMVNYNFRSQVSFQQLHDFQIHCSCLVLTESHPPADQKANYNYFVDRDLYQSLPNLTISLIASDEKLCTSPQSYPNLNCTWSLHNLYESKNDTSLPAELDNSCASFNEECFINDRNDSYVCDCNFVLPVGVTCRCRRKGSRKHLIKEMETLNFASLKHNENVMVPNNVENSLNESAILTESQDITADSDCVIDCLLKDEDINDNYFHNDAFSLHGNEKCRNSSNHHIQNIHSSEIYQIPDPNVSLPTSKVCIVWDNNR